MALPDFNQHKDTCAEDGGSIGRSINRQAAVAISALYKKTNEGFSRGSSADSHENVANGEQANADTNDLVCDERNSKIQTSTNVPDGESEMLRSASGAGNVHEQPQETIEVEFDWLGRFTDVSQESRFQKRRVIQLCILSLQCVQASRLMAVSVNDGHMQH